MNARAGSPLEYWLNTQCQSQRLVFNVKCGQQPLFSGKRPDGHCCCDEKQVLADVQVDTARNYQWDLLLINKRFETNATDLIVTG